jgi:hypothetical protein
MCLSLNENILYNDWIVTLCNIRQLIPSAERSWTHDTPRVHLVAVDDPMDLRKIPLTSPRPLTSFVYHRRHITSSRRLPIIISHHHNIAIHAPSAHHLTTHPLLHTNNTPPTITMCSDNQHKEEPSSAAGKQVLNDHTEPKTAPGPLLPSTKSTTKLPTSLRVTSSAARSTSQAPRKSSPPRSRITSRITSRTTSRITSRIASRIRSRIRSRTRLLSPLA